MAKQTKYKEHVRAAREWLGRAEDSLEQEDHIRGDLDVMLAQAELQRAQEMEEGLAQRRWLRRLLPAGAAAVVAAFVWGVWVSVPPPLVDRPPIMTAAEREGSSSAPVPAAAAAPVAIAPPPAPPMTAEISPVVEEPSSVEVPISEKTAETELLPQPSVRIPSRDMQKLMSAAGQSLRAQ